LTTLTAWKDLEYLESNEKGNKILKCVYAQGLAKVYRYVYVYEIYI
jgi:hypothetical protein